MSGTPTDPSRGLSDLARLERKLSAEHRVIHICTTEEADAVELIGAACVNLGLEALCWSVTGGLRDGLMIGGRTMSGTEHPAAALVTLTTINKRMAVTMFDLVGHLKDERTLRAAREVVSHFSRTGSHLVVIDCQTEMPAPLRAMTTRFEMTLPDELALERVVRETLRTRMEKSRFELDISRRDLSAIVRNLRGLTARQARQVTLDAISFDNRFDAADIHVVLAQKRKAMSGLGLLDYVEAPISLDEVGGLRRLKFWLEQRRNALADDAAAYGLRPPRGVLMLGVQGAGKSLAAKAVATAWQRPLLRMDVGALYDKYIGESEKRLREALHQAEAMAPIVLWIDEIEKAFASAGSANSNDGGLSRRMFGSLLTWMQDHEAPVFLIATANDIESLPPELLRKGRFDEIFFVDLPTPEARREIVRIHLKKRKRDPGSFDLDALVSASEGFSGAEIEQAVIAAMYDAFSAKAEVTTEHVIKAMQSSPPLSVTMAERVAALRQWATERCVPAD